MQNGQALRIQNYVRRLNDRHQFDLVALDDRPVPDELSSLFASIKLFPDPGAGTCSTFMGRIWQSFSVEQIAPAVPEMKVYLEQAFSGDGYDLVWLGGDRVAASLPAKLRVPLLVDLVDDIVLKLLRDMRRAPSLTVKLRTLKRAFMRYRYERRYYGPADGCLVVSEADADMFRRICPRTPVTVIPNGVDSAYYAPQSVEEQSDLLVFEGNMSYAPNIDAVAYFVDQILPLIRRDEPAARLLVVGKDPAPQIQALAGDAVIVTGTVDDVRPYVAGSSVFVCPMTKGTGIKNKVLQAWAMGKPVVGTSLSASGLQPVDGENMLIRDEPQAFASAVIGLIRSPARRRELGRAGRETVEARFSWERQARELDRLLAATVTYHEGRRHA